MALQEPEATTVEEIENAAEAELAAPVEGPVEKKDLYGILRQRRHDYDPAFVADLLGKTDEGRVNALADALSEYIGKNLPAAIDKRKHLADYRTNPYVLLTSANVMKLSNAMAFGQFLFNTKLYMGLETSFGKSIEAAYVGQYPVGTAADARWTDPAEKLAEFAKIKATGASRQEKAALRNDSVWREIDKSCIKGDRRYLVSIKSGPACINDTQVAGMVASIGSNYQRWFDETVASHGTVTGLDVVVGITYGTDLSTNNKENQILAKLLDPKYGFTEEDRLTRPGVLISPTGNVRVYRMIGQDFWAFIGDPENPTNTPFVFLEVLLALAKALSNVMKTGSLEERVNTKLEQLAAALLEMRFPRPDLPGWIRDHFNEDELFWLAAALTEFFDHQAA